MVTYARSEIRISAHDLIELVARLIAWEIPPAALKGCEHEQLELDIADAMKRAVETALNNITKHSFLFDPSE